MDILVVSEDPAFISAVHDIVEAAGNRVLGCLGPAASLCPLERRGVCGMAEHSSIILVDCPPSGSFGRHHGAMPAETYAERLSQAHPGRFVLLCGAAPGAARAAGEIDHVTDRVRALATIQAMLGARV